MESGLNAVDYIHTYLIIDNLCLYRTVPHKVLAGMQWVVMNFPSNYLYSSVDDDIAVHVGNTFHYLQGLNSLSRFDITHSTEQVPIICLYSYQDKDMPSREPASKW